MAKRTMDVEINLNNKMETEDSIVQIKKKSKIEENRGSLYSSNLGAFVAIPQPIFITIFSLLKDNKDLVNTRLVCKLFAKLISGFWSQIIPFLHFPAYLENIEKGIAVKPCNLCIKNKNLHILKRNLVLRLLNSSKLYKDTFLSLPLETLQIDINDQSIIDFFPPLPISINKYVLIGECSLTHLNNLPPHLKKLQILKKSASQLALKDGFIDNINININISFGTKEDYFTPLTLISNIGTPDLIKKLINRGANVDKEDLSGRTPLQSAILNKKNHNVKFLLENGANINKCGSIECNKNTPLFIACQNGFDEIVELLLKNNADIYKTYEKYYCYPICIASIKNYYKVFETLLRCGVDVKKINNVDNCDPLYNASMYGYYKLVELLIKYCDPNAIQGSGLTALHIAIQYRHCKIIELLLKNGADPNKLSKFGMSPLEMTERNNIKVLLMKYGATYTSKDLINF
jgi:ankyrin repeat protein